MKHRINRQAIPAHLLTLILLVGVLAGCEPTDQSRSTSPVNQSSSPGANGNINPSDVKIDASMQTVASEFERRLGYYDGKLRLLTFENGRVIAKWSSQKCDWIKEEIIDLAISINRGQIGLVNEIDIDRSCNSKVKVLRISGQKFNAYQSGKMSDTQFLEGVK